MSVFSSTAFIPLAIGFFGLATGYLVWGGQAVFGSTPSSPELDRTMGLWGIWMSGFMQFLTGLYLMVGLTWFQVFTNQAPLYMAALAFTAYGVHWFAMAYRKYKGGDETPEGWMAIAFLFLSILGMSVFFIAGDVPVALLFIGLSLIYLFEIPTKFSGSKSGARWVGVFQLLTGVWLLYLTYGVVINTAVGGHWWI